MPNYLYVLLFLSVILGGCYIAFSCTKFKLVTLIFRTALAISVVLLAVFGIVAVSGGLSTSTMIFSFMLLGSTVLFLGKEIYLDLASYKNVKSNVLNLVDEITTLVGHVLLIVAMTIYFGFSYYTFIFFAAFAIIFYLLNYLFGRKSQGKNQILFIVYDVVVSFAVATALSGVVFSSASSAMKNVSIFLFIGYVLYYLADMFKYGRMLSTIPLQKDEQVVGVFGITFYVIANILFAFSLGFVFLWA